MNEKLIDVVLGAVAAVVAQKLAKWVLDRRTNGNGVQASRSLRASRELADLTTNLEDMISRVGALELSIQRLWKEKRQGHRED